MISGTFLPFLLHAVGGTVSPWSPRMAWIEAGGLELANNAFAQKGLKMAEKATMIMKSLKLAGEVYFQGSPLISARDEKINAMCSHVASYPVLYAKLANVEINKYSHFYTQAELNVDQQVVKGYLVKRFPFLNLHLLCTDWTSYNIPSMPLVLKQIVLRSLTARNLSDSKDEDVLPAPTQIVDVTTQYTVEQLYRSTMGTESIPKLVSLFAQSVILDSIQSLTIFEDMAIAIGRLMGLSVAHAVPMGNVLSTPLMENILCANQNNCPTTGALRLGTALFNGMNEVLALDQIERDLIDLFEIGNLIAGELKNTPNTDYLVGVTPFIDWNDDAIGFYLMRYLRGYDTPAKAPIRLQSFISHTTGLSYLPIGSLQVMDPNIKVVATPYTANSKPEFFPELRQVKLPKYTNFEAFTQALDNHFNI